MNFLVALIETFTRAKLEQEGTSNYGIPPSDWQEYTHLPLRKTQAEFAPFIEDETTTSDEKHS